jgi:hypothetical protein
MVEQQMGGLPFPPPMFLLSLTKTLCTKRMDISVPKIPFVIL